jgi:Rad3-related DNA helicase
MSTVLTTLSRALTPREPQRRLAEFIDSARSPAIAVQADTGTGKTAVLLSSAIVEAKRGHRVIISTHTIQLLRQAERESKLFEKEGITFGVRLGMRNFISSSRVEAVWGRLIARDELTEEDEAQLRDLLRFARDGTGLIEDYTEAYGDLPAGLRANDICLLPSARKADKAAWQRSRQSIEDVQVTIQTHALTLIQSRFGELPPVIIFDEADALGDTADSAEDKRLSLSELGSTMKFVGITTSLLDTLVAKPKDVRRREALAEVLKVKSDDEEVRFALSSARWILTAHRLDSLRRGTQVIKEGNDTIIRSLWVNRARWIWPNLIESGVQKAIFASATLAVGGDVALSLRRYGVPVESVEGGSFSPRQFGTMSFKIIPETTSHPVKDGEVNPEWREDASSWLVREGLMKDTSRPLVLAKSYADTRYFAEKLGLTGQEQGQSLSGYLERFRSGEIRGLVTPAGWVGVDLPGLITDVVILRLPYAAVDDFKTELLGRTDFPAIKAEMQRKLKQGLGRGIRKEDDRVTVWFTDPRIHDLRNGILAAIPERFSNAFLLALHKLRLTTGLVRTEQEKFRDELIARYGGRCAVTGSTILSVLEAAHKPGRSWKSGHNRAEDGILLRADIHKLLDDGLLSIEHGVVRIDQSVASEYGAYEGKLIV